MGRIRTCKPEFHSHEELSSLPAETHLLANALLNYADDQGYFNANPLLVKAGTNPLRQDKTKIEDQLKQLESIGYIEIRKQGVRSMGKIVSFQEHQRVSHPTPSKLIDKFESLPINSGEIPDILRPEQGTGNREQGREGNREASSPIGLEAIPPVVALKLTGNKTHIVTQADVAAYREAYPGVDIIAELRKVPPWLDANPTKRSANIIGSKQRIVKWLSRAQNNTGGLHGEHKQSVASRNQDETNSALAKWADSGYGPIGDAYEPSQGLLSEPEHSRADG